MSTDENKNSGNNTNTAQDINPVIRKNRFQPNSRYFTIVIYGLMFVLGTILLVRIVGSFNNTVKLLGQALQVIAPFLVGAFIAFILYPLVRFFYRNLFKNTLHMKSDKLSKWLSILVTYVIAIGVIAILMVFILPQLYTSITDIVDRLPVWYNNLTTMVDNFENRHADLGFIDYNLINEHLTSLYPKIISYLTDTLANLLPYVVNTSMAIVKGVVNLIISIMVSVYMISDHKNIFYQFKKLLYAVFPKQAADTARAICRESTNIFLKFMYGKAIDSVIIGIICFVCMNIFKFPYTVLISVIVGITNMIPYFGPYIGGVLGGIIIVIVNPVQVIFFAVMILVIQQFDGLFLGPKILGDSTGLKPLWVIFAIVVGGAMFGVLGMFLGVPTMAVICYILNIVVEHFLKKRNITVQPYDSPDKM
ncbi:putative permease [Eubacterium sp. CAG:252]|jgi:predicted PurR-regulated permease PerM|nr:putative permease [Eubacterium sp. CAG:252]